MHLSGFTVDTVVVSSAKLVERAVINEVVPGAVLESARALNESLAI